MLATACALASFVVACATPFAAFAVVAAAALPPQSALLVTVAAWLIKQAIGFGFLHYPVDATTIAWGFVIGGAAVAATAASMTVLRLMQRTGTVVALIAALMGTYAAYDLVLFAATPFLGGAEDFTGTIVGRLGLLNVFWTIGLVAACEISRLYSLTTGARRHAMACTHKNRARHCPLCGEPDMAITSRNVRFGPVDSTDRRNTPPL